MTSYELRAARTRGARKTRGRPGLIYIRGIRTPYYVLRTSFNMLSVFQVLDQLQPLNPSSSAFPRRLPNLWPFSQRSYFLSRRSVGC